MNDDEFDWDPQKAAANLADHKVGFELAKGVFRDPFAIEFLDDREDYGEDRFVIIGMTEGRLLTVVYTLRADRTRIISARRAEPRERRRYHDQDSEDRLD